MLRNKNVFHYLFFILLGGVVAAFQFTYNKAFWGDEAALALNIVERDFQGLLQPLDNIQVAPIGFLYIVKALQLAFGGTEMVLRILPLLGFMGSIPLFFLVTKAFFKKHDLALFATALFAFNPSFIFFSADFKQYSTDIFFCLLILFVTLRHEHTTSKSRLQLGMLGMVVLFSNVAIFVLFVVGLYYTYRWLTKEEHPYILGVLVFWGINVLAYYFAFLYEHPSQAVQIAYWTSVRGFIPSILSGPEWIGHISSRIIPIFQDFMPMLKQTRFEILPSIVFLLGLSLLFFRKNLLFVYFFLSVVFVHLTLSTLEIYPFARRLVNYMGPFFIMTFAYGAYETFILVKRRFPLIPSTILVIPILLMFYPSYNKYPIESRSSIKQAVAYLNQKVKPNEIIYVGNFGYNTVRYYEKTGELDPSLASSLHKWKLQPTKTINAGHLSQIKQPSWVLLESMWEWRIPDEQALQEQLKTLNLQLVELKKFDRTNCYHIAPSNLFVDNIEPQKNQDGMEEEPFNPGF